jgi:hypothetical protein
MTTLELRDLLNEAIEAEPRNANAQVYCNGFSFTMAHKNDDSEFEATKIESIYLGTNEDFYINAWVKIYDRFCGKVKDYFSLYYEDSTPRYHRGW